MKSIKVKVKGARLSNYVLDTFIAHRLSKLTECGAKDMFSMIQPWLNGLILNTIFMIRIRTPYNKLIFNFLRRVEGVFIEYEQGRKQLINYVNNRRIHPEKNIISPYFRALQNFETLLAQSYQAYWFLEAIVRTHFESQAKKEEFEKNKEQIQNWIFKSKTVGKTIRNICKLYIDSRHMDAKIAQGNIPSQAMSAIWITNEGLESKNAKVNFEELYELLKRFSEISGLINK